MGGMAGSKRGNVSKRREFGHFSNVTCIINCQQLSIRCYKRKITLRKPLPLSVSVHNISWSSEIRPQQEVSVCSSPCKKGEFRSRTSACCWECRECAYTDVVDASDPYTCIAGKYGKARGISPRLKSVTSSSSSINPPADSEGGGRDFCPPPSP